MSEQKQEIFDPTTTRSAWAAYENRTTAREEADRAARKEQEHEAIQQLLATADPKGKLLAQYRKATADRDAAIVRRDQITVELTDLQAQRPTDGKAILSQIGRVNEIQTELSAKAGAIAELEALYQQSRGALAEAVQKTIRQQARKTDSEVTRLNAQYKVDIMHARQGNALWNGFGRRLERSTGGLDDLLGLA